MSSIANEFEKELLRIKTTIQEAEDTIDVSASRLGQLLSRYGSSMPRETLVHIARLFRVTANNSRDGSYKAVIYHRLKQASLTDKNSLTATILPNFRKLLQELEDVQGGWDILINGQPEFFVWFTNPSELVDVQLPRKEWLSRTLLGGIGHRAGYTPLVDRALLFKNLAIVEGLCTRDQYFEDLKESFRDYALIQRHKKEIAVWEKELLEAERA